MQLKPIKISIFLTAAVAILLLSAQWFPARAQDDMTYTPSGTGQELVCRGSRNWAAYGVAIWNQFMDPRDLTEYFKDLLIRYNDNFCLYEDIYGKLKSVDKAREGIRKAFYNCTSSDKLKDTYYSIESEIYFLRYYIVYGPYVSDEGESKVGYHIKAKYPDADWHDFNEELFPEEQKRIDLYNKFKSTYGGRMETYDQCKDPSIETLILKFKDDIDYLEQTVKQAGKAISQKAKRLANTASSLYNSVRSGEYFKNMLEARINGMPCPLLGSLIGTEEEKKENRAQCGMAIKDIYDAIKANTPLVGSGISFETVHNTAQKAKEQAQIIVKKTNVMAKYEFMFYEGSDNLVQEILKTLGQLSNILDQSFPVENQTINCVRSVGKSQCANIMGAGASY